MKKNLSWKIKINISTQRPGEYYRKWKFLNFCKKYKYTKEWVL